MRRTILVLAGMSILVPSVGRADELRRHEKKQEHRIHRGEKSGELTKKESRKLESEEDQLQQEREDAKADGKVTPGERREIRHDQKKLSQEIYRKKHNDQDRQ